MDLEEQDKRKALKTVLQLQRKLGLSKAAGTDAMSIDGPPKGFQGLPSPQLRADINLCI